MNKSNVKPLKNSKALWLLLTVLSMVFIGLLFLTVTYTNMLYHWFSDAAPFVILLPALLALAASVISLFISLKFNQLTFAAPFLIALIGCMLVFYFSNNVFNDKLSGDFLKRETAFDRAVEQLDLSALNTADPYLEYEVTDPSLKGAIPEMRVRVYNVDGHPAYYFLAMESKDRTEGYVCTPSLVPEEWYNGEWSEAFDLTGRWSYLVLYK